MVEIVDQKKYLIILCFYLIFGYNYSGCHKYIPFARLANRSKYSA